MLHHRKGVLGEKLEADGTCVDSGLDMGCEAALAESSILASVHCDTLYLLKSVIVNAVYDSRAAVLKRPTID